MNEQWKDIIGFENYYKISNYGEIYSKRKNKIMKPYLIKKGYLRINLYLNKKVVRKLIHILVIENFGETKPFETSQVNHKDLNKINNHINNLEWTSPSENVNHAITNLDSRKEYLQDSMRNIGKEYYKLGIKASKKPVVQINLLTNEIIQRFDSARDASRLTYSNYKSISKVCNKERKSHNGYGWEFI